MFISVMKKSDVETHMNKKFILQIENWGFYYFVGQKKNTDNNRLVNMLKDQKLHIFNITEGQWSFRTVGKYKFLLYCYVKKANFIVKICLFLNHTLNEFKALI